MDIRLRAVSERKSERERERERGEKFKAVSNVGRSFNGAELTGEGGGWTVQLLSLK